MPEKVWTTKQKAGMRVAKTTGAIVVATAVSKLLGFIKPELDTPSTVAVLAVAITALQTWWRNRKKKEVKK